MGIPNLEERGSATREVAHVDTVAGTPRDEVHVELFGGVVVEMTAERVNVEDDEAVLAGQRKDLTSKVRLDAGLVRPRFH